MTTESKSRATYNTPVNRLALALVDILTGVTEVSVKETSSLGMGRRWILGVKRIDVQDNN